MINKALEIACKAHSHQYDKGGKSYILHPLHVMHQMDTEDEMIVAVLHDVMEDNERYHPELLIEAGIPEHCVGILDKLTWRKGGTYSLYIEHIAHDPIAIKVKLADLRHNMDLSRLPEITEADRTRWNKYAKAVKYLERAYSMLTGSVECGYCGARAGQTVTDGPGEGDTYTGNWRKTVAGIMWQCDGGEWIQGEYPEYYGGVE